MAAIDLISDNDTLFLAVASYGLDAMSSIWSLNKTTDQFEAMKYIVTVGKPFRVKFSTDAPRHC